MGHSTNFINLTGTRIEKWVILKFTGKKRRRDPIWLCQCDCGIIKEVTSNSLRNGSKSCGCLKHENSGRPKIPGAIYSSLIARYKFDAKSRNLDFNLNRNDFIDLTKLNCFYCNKNPSNKIIVKNIELIYNGIDRIDNSKGYILDNVVTCCKKCNSDKKSISVEMIIKLYNLMKSKGIIT